MPPGPVSTRLGPKNIKKHIYIYIYICHVLRRRFHTGITVQTGALQPVRLSEVSAGNYHQHQSDKHRPAKVGVGIC